MRLLLSVSSALFPIRREDEQSRKKSPRQQGDDCKGDRRLLPIVCRRLRSVSSGVVKEVLGENSHDYDIELNPAPETVLNAINDYVADLGTPTAFSSSKAR